MNAQGGKEGGGTFEPRDFFPALPGAREPAQTPEEQIAIWKAMGAKDLRDTGD